MNDKPQPLAVPPQTEEIVPPTEFGVHFISLIEYPKVIERVVDVEATVNKWAPELDWALATLKKFKGYGIALPQIGAPVNIALMRSSIRDEPALLLNMEYSGDHTKVARISREADYSIGSGLIFFTVNRFSKITATWDTWNADAKAIKHCSKVLKVPSSVQTMPPSIVFQNLADHMRDGYPQHLRNKLSRHAGKNAPVLALVDSVLAGGGDHV